jgi:hypothetical protein
MSFSNPTLTNPAKHFYRWAGSTGKLQWYDKEKEDTVDVPLPFKFIVLDQLGVITGYNKPAKTGFYSNEVRNSRQEEFIVKSNKQTVYQGFYKNEQGIVQMPKGTEYAQSIYIAHKDGEEWVIGNIRASGSARSAWFDFKKAHEFQSEYVVMSKGDVQTAPTGDFYPPKFASGKLSQEQIQPAMELDQKLQIYLNQYLSTPKVENIEDDANDDDIGKATPEQIKEFEDRKAAAKQPQTDDEKEPAVPDVVIEDIGDELINLDDIPF